MRCEACAVYILSNLNRSVLYVGVTSVLVTRVAEIPRPTADDGGASE